MGREWALIGPQSFRLAAVTLTAALRGDCHCGWYCKKHGGQRPHTHTHINISTDTLSLPLSSVEWWSPLLSCPRVSQGRPNLLCHQKLIPSFSPPPPTPSALISSYLKHSSSSLLSHPSCSTATPPGLGILKLFCWFQACDLPQKVLPLSSDRPINSFFSPPLLSYFSFWLFRCDAQCPVRNLHRSGVLCQSEVISMVILLPVSLFGLTKYPARSYHLFCCLLMCLLKTQRNTSFRSNKDVSFPALQQFTVHENTIASWIFFYLYFLSQLQIK